MATLPDLDDIETAAQALARGGTECVTCMWLDSLPDDYADLFRRLFANRSVQLPRIYEQAVRCGFTYTSSAMDNHRRNHVPA